MKAAISSVFSDRCFATLPASYYYIMHHMQVVVGVEVLLKSFNQLHYNKALIRPDSIQRGQTTSLYINPFTGLPV
jgi:hypothetical protein